MTRLVSVRVKFPGDYLDDDNPPDRTESWEFGVEIANIPAMIQLLVTYDST